MTDDGARAPGAPGVPPTWSSSEKDAVGTSHFSSRVWFTVGHGILNEVYWPRVDRPQIRDLGFIVADDAGFWSEVKRDASHDVHSIAPGVPAIVATHSHPRYTLTLRICADDHADVIHVEAKLDDPRDVADPARLAHPLRLYPLLAPHLGFSGLHNRAWTGTYKGRAMLFAQTGPSALALASDPGPARQSVGFVGTSDGWQDFATNGRMAWTYEATDPGNVAGMTELVLSDGIARLALGFGTRPEEAGLEACAALAGHFENAWDEYVGNWHGFLRTVSDPPEDVPEADRALYLTSAAVLRTHADRTVPGAIVASLSIPWGSSRNDLGGYHLVWSRDLVESAGALVALGAGRTARRTLAYLVATQEPDGSWVQNQWVDGVAYWSGLQLDEAAYPILLAGALRRGGAAEMHGMAGSDAQAFEHLLTEDSLEHMIRSAARFIARTGPATGQDRWEEDAGLTPSTLAPVVAALVVAADHCVEPAATYLRELADDWNASIEDWTYARGTRLSREHGVDGHYVRIASPDVLAGAPISTPVAVRNRPPEASIDPGGRDGGHRLPGPRPVRPAHGRRPADPRHARRHRRASADGDPKRPSLASLQRGRLRRARGRERLRRHRDRPRLAAAGRRARPLRAGGRTRRTPVPRGDAPDGVRWRDAARAGLGRGADPRPRARSGPAQRIRHAARLGARRVRQAPAVDRPRPRHRPAGRGMAPVPRRGARGEARNVALHRTSTDAGRRPPAPAGAARAGSRPLVR